MTITNTLASSPVIERLAVALESTLNASSPNWIELIGAGDEANNTAALRFWLENLLTDPDTETGERLIPILLERLEEILIENERT